MSQENLAKVIERACTDAAFRSQLQSNLETALAGYELTAEEKAALKSGDSGKIGAMGVDARITKQALGGETNPSGPFPQDPFVS